MNADPQPSPYYDPSDGRLPVAITWETPEHKHHERSRDWYWALGLGAAALFGLGIYLHDALFAVLVAIATFGVLILALRKPSIITVDITSRGIKMHNQLYPYVTLDSFWLTPTETDRKIIIRSRKKLMTWIVIPVPDHADEHIIREYLLQHMREEEHPIPLVDAIMDRLRF
jgi:hypothetical protein